MVLLVYFRFVNYYFCVLKIVPISKYTKGPGFTPEDTLYVQWGLGKKRVMNHQEYEWCYAMIGLHSICCSSEQLIGCHT